MEKTSKIQENEDIKKNFHQPVKAKVHNAKFSAFGLDETKLLKNFSDVRFLIKISFENGIYNFSRDFSMISSLFLLCFREQASLQHQKPLSEAVLTE